MTREEYENLDLYETLGVEQTASQSVIKRAYRKLAMKWHPDRHMETEEKRKLAHDTFEKIQHAYTILGNVNNRADYDNRSTYIDPDDLLDLEEYTNTKQFTFDEKENDYFYKVYDRFFRALYKEEIKCMPRGKGNNKKNKVKRPPPPPSFGGPNSDYNEVVSKFYGYWSKHKICKTFQWLDKYASNHEDYNRSLRRQVDQINDKARREGKRIYKDQLKKLIQFVKDHDPRVQKELERKRLVQVKHQEEVRNKKKEEARRRKEAQLKRIEELQREQEELYGEYDSDEEYYDSVDELEDDLMDLYAAQDKAEEEIALEEEQLDKDEEQLDDDEKQLDDDDEEEEEQFDEEELNDTEEEEDTELIMNVQPSKKKKNKKKKN